MADTILITNNQIEAKHIGNRPLVYTTDGLAIAAGVTAASVSAGFDLVLVDD